MGSGCTGGARGVNVAEAFVTEHTRWQSVAGLMQFSETLLPGALARLRAVADEVKSHGGDHNGPVRIWWVRQVSRSSKTNSPNLLVTLMCWFIAPGRGRLVASRKRQSTN